MQVGIILGSIVAAILIMFLIYKFVPGGIYIDSFLVVVLVGAGSYMTRGSASVGSMIMDVGTAVVLVGAALFLNYMRHQDDDGGDND